MQKIHIHTPTYKYQNTDFSVLMLPLGTGCSIGMLFLTEDFFSCFQHSLIAYRFLA